MGTLRIVFASLMTFACLGCTAIPIISGKHPPTDRLEGTLVVGKSGFGQVLEVLGEPDGQGRALLPMYDGLRFVWNYQYQAGTPNDLEVALLLVVFDEAGIYDGYLCFSSVSTDLR